MLTCPHCGALTYSSKIKCHHCGGIVREDLGPAPSPHDVPGLSAPKATSAGGEVLVPATVERASASAACVVQETRVETAGRKIVDITEKVNAFVGNAGGTGIVNVFLPHATAGLALMETGSGSEVDLGGLLEQLAPSDDRYVHQHGPRGHGRDHLIPVLVSPSINIPVENGRLALGRWQSLVLVDTNESNNLRELRMTLLRG
jgi:secondary thiamine-phosphate synthase enzyme